MIQIPFELYIAFAGIFYILERNDGYLSVSLVNFRCWQCSSHGSRINHEGIDRKFCE